MTKAPPPSDHDLREMLHEAVVMDLLGPASGPEEEIFGTSVRDRYLVGKLAPKESADRPRRGRRSRPEAVMTAARMVRPKARR